jgi:hypothetical protein
MQNPGPLTVPRFRDDWKHAVSRRFGAATTVQWTWIGIGLRPERKSSSFLPLVWTDADDQIQ